MVTQTLKIGNQDTVIAISSLSSGEIVGFALDEHEVWCEQAKKLTSLGHYSAALASYDRTLAIQPNHCEAWILRGGVLTHLDRYEEALASFEKALEIEPNNQLALAFRGMALHHLGRYKQAYASYDQALGIQRRSLFSKVIQLFKL